MRTTLTAVCAAAFALLAFAAPVPKALKKREVNWMPISAGSRWEYSSPEDPNTVNEIREILAVTEKGGDLIAEQRTSNLDQVFRQDSTGIAVIKSGGRDHANPRYIIKNGMKEGDTWDWDATGYIETRTVGKMEKIKVPAGEYDAQPVNFKYVQNGNTFQSGTVWYSDGIGLVRIDTEGSESQVLKAYTPGAAKK